MCTEKKSTKFLKKKLDKLFKLLYNADTVRMCTEQFLTRSRNRVRIVLLQFVINREGSGAVLTAPLFFFATFFFLVFTRRQNGIKINYWRRLRREWIFTHFAMGDIMSFHRTAVHIDLDAIEHNLAEVRRRLPDGVRLLAVIKADAYGHGAVPLASFLKDSCDYFGVACIEEGIELRRAGIENPVLLLGYTDNADMPAAVEYGLIPAIFTLDNARALSDAATGQHKRAAFHFAVDTGMSRIGLQVTEADADLCAQIVQLPGIYAEGIFSHYATADEKDLTKSHAQTERFVQFLAMLKARGIQPKIAHLSNSAGIMNFDERFQMVRSGIITYGLYPSDEVDHTILALQPAMQWTARISYVKQLPPGREVSYGGTYTTPGERVIATVPVGYADGYPRCLSGIGRVLVNGQYAPIVGRVCMDQFMIDVTGIPDVSADTEAVLIGKQGQAAISMEEVANAAHSFNYEMACRIARRVPRVYYRHGQEVQTVQYLLD